jgi:site-specific DNA recombinase
MKRRTIAKQKPTAEQRDTLRVALYTRISTDEEHQPYSLEAQSDRLDSYVRSQDNWQVSRLYQDQMTGTVLERPGLQEALEDARKGRFDLLLVFRVDRLARSVRSLALILEQLDQHGVAFRSATEPFDTTAAAGRMMVQMLGVFAEFERATLIERVVAGMEKKAAKGGWNGGTRPLGYDYNPDTGALIINETEAAIVRKAFDLYASTLWGTTSLARRLTDEGYRTKKGALWSPATLRNLLSNRVYLGEVYFRDTYYPGQHPPLVETEMFDRVQQILDERGERAELRRSNRSDYALSGTLKCARCGARFVGYSGRGNGGEYRYYICGTRVKFGPKHCDQQRLPAGDLEKHVVEHLIACLRDRTLIEQAIQQVNARWDRARPKQKRELAAVESQLREMRAGVDRYLRAFETGAMDPQLCGERLVDLKAQLTGLERRRLELTDALAADPAKPSVKDTQAAARQLARELEKAPRPKVKTLLRRLIDHLSVESRAVIHPVIRVPLVSTTTRWVGPPGFEPGTKGL